MSKKNKINLNPVNYLYGGGLIIGGLIIYKAYKIFFPKKDVQLIASTNLNQNLTNQSNLSDEYIYSLIDELISYINPPYFGTNMQEIKNLINSISIADFSKLNALFGKKRYNTILGEVIRNPMPILDDVFPLIDLRTILLYETSGEDADFVRDIYNQIK